MDSVIEKNIRSIRARIRSAAEKSGQAEEDIKLVAVTKNVAVGAIQAAIEAGISDIGENKAQEACYKFEQLGRGVTWHFVGHLQRNKVKSVIGFVDLIHSVDSARLAEEIDRRAQEIGKIQDILVQVNIADEETKFGVSKEDTKGLLEEIVNLRNVKVKGLMNIAPFAIDSKEVRAVFAEMKMLFEDLKKMGIPAIEMEYLSMGMTHDFEVAIEAGSNMVRIGTGIFSSVS